MRRLLVTFAGAMVAATLVSCASIPLSRTYLGDRAFGTTLVAPAGWETFDAASVLAGAPGASPGFIQGFGPAVADPTRPMVGAAPGGLLVVNLYPGLAAARSAARNAFITDLAAAEAAGDVTVLEETAPVTEGVWERRSLLLEVRFDAGTVTRVRQETMVGTSSLGRAADGTELFPLKTLIIGCDPSCFAENVSVVDDVVDSWRVW